MSDHNDAPEEHVPEGGIPLPSDHLGSDGQEHPEMPETMIDNTTPHVHIEDEQPREDVETREVVTASGTVINVADVEAEADAMIGEGQPLPVGAHDPSVEQPAGPPPGMPKAPDEVDEVLAGFVDAIFNDAQERYTYGGSPALNGSLSRPDNATLPDAMFERILDITPVGPREALLVQIASLRKREREAALAWAKAVREQQEQRESFVHFRKHREHVTEAMETLGLLTEADRGETEPVAKHQTIPDDLIV